MFGRDLRLTLAGVNGAVAVLASAAAAHGWGLVGAAELIETGSRLHLMHSVLLVGVALLLRSGGGGLAAWASFWMVQIGCLLFCGALYYGAFTGLRPPSMIAPAGGMSLTIGWLALAAAGLTRVGGVRR